MYVHVLTCTWYMCMTNHHPLQHTVQLLNHTTCTLHELLVLLLFLVNLYIRTSRIHTQTCWPTIYHMHLYNVHTHKHTYIQVTPEMHTMAKFLMELCLQDYPMLQYLPSQQAAAALYLSIKIFDDSLIQWVNKQTTLKSVFQCHNNTCTCSKIGKWEWSY